MFLVLGYSGCARGDGEANSLAGYADLKVL